MQFDGNNSDIILIDIIAATRGPPINYNNNKFTLSMQDSFLQPYAESTCLNRNACVDVSSKCKRGSESNGESSRVSNSPTDNPLINA